MDTFTVNLRVWNCEHPEKFEEFDVVVDAAEAFSRISRSRLERLGVKVSRKMPFRTPEGRVVERELGTVQVAAEGRMAFENVVMAEDGEIELLGSHTVEGFGLAVDQIQRKLVPTVMWALGVGSSLEPWLEAKS
jgi:predicted aspartyl protease